jgi:hypothetical protein
VKRPLAKSLARSRRARSHNWYETLHAGGLRAGLPSFEKEPSMLAQLSLANSSRAASKRKRKGRKFGCVLKVDGESKPLDLDVEIDTMVRSLRRAT